jgi:hypothetical protein
MCNDAQKRRASHIHFFMCPPLRSFRSQFSIVWHHPTRRSNSSANYAPPPKPRCTAILRIQTKDTDHCNSNAPSSHHTYFKFKVSLCVYTTLPFTSLNSNTFYHFFIHIASALLTSIHKKGSYNKQINILSCICCISLQLRHFTSVLLHITVALLLLCTHRSHGDKQTNNAHNA